jgi:hypothetical protein
MTNLSAIREARIDAACRAIVARFADALNRRNLNALEALLAPELFWELPTAEPARSPAAVCQGLTELWAHYERDDVWLDIDIGKTCSIEVVSERLAHSSIWMVMYSGVDATDHRVRVAKDKAELIGRCRQSYVLTQRGWRIAEHRAIPMYHSTTFSLPTRQRFEQTQFA